MKNKSIILQANDKLVEMIEKIKEARVLDSRASVIRFCIVETYNKYYKTYGKDSLNTDATTVRQPAKTKAEKEEIEETRMCVEDLDGTVEDKAGIKMCHYSVIEKLNPTYLTEYRQVVPLSMLNKAIVDRKYYPSKEEVQETLAAGIIPIVG